MPSKEIEEFAEALIREVRDNSISSCDVLIDPDSDDVVAKRLRSLRDNLENMDYAKALIPECVDVVLFHLLNAIDNEHLRLSFRSSNGNDINLFENGEMAGWYMGGEWREKYSKQRFVDDFEDL